MGGARRHGCHASLCGRLAGSHQPHCPSFMCQPVSIHPSAFSSMRLPTAKARTSMANALMSAPVCLVASPDSRSARRSAMAPAGCRRCRLGGGCYAARGCQTVAAAARQASNAPPPHECGRHLVRASAARKARAQQERSCWNSRSHTPFSTCAWGAAGGGASAQARGEAAPPPATTAARRPAPAHLGQRGLEAQTVLLDLGGGRGGPALRFAAIAVAGRADRAPPAHLGAAGSQPLAERGGDPVCRPAPSSHRARAPLACLCAQLGPLGGSHAAPIAVGWRRSSPMAAGGPHTRRAPCPSGGSGRGGDGGCVGNQPVQIFLCRSQEAAQVFSLDLRFGTLRLASGPHASRPGWQATPSQR